MASRPESFARRFRRHAAWLEREGRSPLYVRVLRAAASDIETGGRVARLVDGIDAPPGASPQLRFLAALHELVLAGNAPALAEFFPSAGGDRSPDAAWPAAAAVIEERFGWIRGRMELGVQTNEAGRSTVLFGALLWLATTYRMPIRLLEIGASAGLNLRCDRYCYSVDGRLLGDPESPLRFVQPWAPAPAVDLDAAAAQLRIVSRAGCDLSPLDPGRAEDRLRLLSYIWPDELERIERARTALELAAAMPCPIAPRTASVWLAEVLAGGNSDVLTVVWHSVMRMYVPGDEWKAIERELACATAPTVVLGMELSSEQLGRFELTMRDSSAQPPRRVAWCRDHGPPVSWV